MSEHVRGLEQKANFLIQGGCDMIHADPEYDMGITGVMKIAHFVRGLVGICKHMYADLHIGQSFLQSETHICTKWH